MFVDYIKPAKFNIACMHADPHIAPYLQTSSTYNERIWVEVNKRVTYPIKAVIVMMNALLIWTDKYCVSIVLRRVCASQNGECMEQPHYTTTLYHEKEFCNNPVDPSDIPTAADAVAAYRGQGGRLTDPSDFGEDLSPHPLTAT